MPCTVRTPARVPDSGQCLRCHRDSVAPQDSLHDVAQRVFSVPTHAPGPQGCRLRASENSLHEQRQLKQCGLPVIHRPGVRHLQRRDLLAQGVKAGFHLLTEGVFHPPLLRILLLTTYLGQNGVELGANLRGPPGRPLMLPVSAAGDFECGADGRPLQRLTVQHFAGEVQVLAAGLSVHIEGRGGLSQIRFQPVGNAVLESLASELPASVAPKPRILFRGGPFDVVVRQVADQNLLTRLPQRVHCAVSSQDPSFQCGAEPGFVTGVDDELEDVLQRVWDLAGNRRAPQHDFPEQAVVLQRTFEGLAHDTVVLKPTNASPPGQTCAPGRGCRCASLSLPPAEPLVAASSASQCSGSRTAHSR